MTRRDWLLLYCATKPSQSLSPLQIQKGLFLFAMEAGAPEDERYEFTPYNYGPCSMEIYGDVRALADDGLLSESPAPATGYSLHSLTPKGVEAADRLKAGANPGLLQGLAKAKTFVTERYFQQLLRDVYSKYPTYAKNSLWQHLTPDES